MLCGSWRAPREQTKKSTICLSNGGDLALVRLNRRPPENSVAAQASGYVKARATPPLATIATDKTIFPRPTDSLNDEVYM